MPKRSVREMKEWELFHFCLATKVFRSTLIGALLIGLIAMAVGLGLYTVSLVEQDVSKTYGLACAGAAIMEMYTSGGTAQMAMDVMEIYHGLTEEERAQTGTEAYRDRFRAMMERSSYAHTLTTMTSLLEAGEAEYLYLGVFDRATKALVYICDPGNADKPGYFIGEWEPLEERELNKFLDWREGDGRLYDISNTERYGWMCTSGCPALGGDSDMRIFVLADITLTGVIYRTRTFVIQYTAVLLAAVVLVGLIMARYMKRKLATPINEIAGAAQRYVSDRRKGIVDTDHFSRLQIHTGDEVENLSLVMADMERDLTDYEENLTRATAEKERIGTELSLARRIQANMLPNTFPPYPDRTEFDIYATMTPAKEVGGDFYDFFLLDHDHLALVMADVSGKGIPAALFMMGSKILVQNTAMAGQGPAAVLETVNSRICSNNREEMFVTVWLGILDLTTGHLTAANAGHEYPAIQERDGGLFELLHDAHSFVIGGMDGVQYREYELDLRPGARLFLYTDGLPEATDAREEAFGTGRMIAALNEAADRTPREILGHVQNAVDCFAGGVAPFDDMTMLCIQYRGRAPEKEAGA